MPRPLCHAFLMIHNLAVRALQSQVKCSCFKTGNIKKRPAAQKQISRRSHEEGWTHQQNSREPLIRCWNGR
ncbi:hypothetical protein FKM82_003655 [Ascaphus truei]